MSLRVWLPLNGDLRNNGLDDFSITTYGTTSFVNSKLGKGLNCNRYSYWVIDNINVGSNMSITFWAKAMSNGMAWVLGSNDSALLNFWAYNDTYYLNAGDAYNNPFKDNSNTNVVSFIDGTWHHFAVIFNSTETKLYIDGEYAGKAVTFRNPTTTNGILKIGGGYRDEHSHDWYGVLNDFRLYDCALSIKEIKEIAKGLVLHYSLADKYIENTTNLITTEDCLSTTCYNGAISKYSYGTNTDMYKEVTTFQGKKGTKVYNQTNGTGMYPYVYISNMYTSDGTNSPAYKTLSFDYYTTISTSICPYKLGSGNGIATYIVTNNETQTGTGTNQVVIPVKPNMWNHIEVTFHGTTEADAQWGYIQNQPSHTSDTSNFWFFANMQLEEKNHATGYVGTGGSRTVNMIYDTSGFENNGTLVGNFEYSFDTSRYDVCTKFNGTDNCIQIGNWYNVFQNPFTINLWWKKEVLGSKNYETLVGGGSGFEMDTRSNSAQMLSLYMTSTRGGNVYSPFNFNQWYMVTMVNDGTNELYYVDGELVKTIEKKSMPNTDYFIGSWQTATKQNYCGLMSDFRIYATALSADQILELYKTPASIDKNNNFYSYSYNELNQGNEIEYLYNLSKSQSGSFIQDKDGLHLNQYVWVTHDYIPIDPTNKIYKYDIIYSNDAGNLLYIGWERYDANKTSRSNNACVYVLSNATERNYYRIKGTVDLSTDTVNPCAFIKLRILNKWTGSESDTNGTATIHYLSLKEYTDTTTQDMTPLNINKQGIVNTTEILEKDIGVSVSNVYELNSHNFYEY